MNPPSQIGKARLFPAVNNWSRLPWWALLTVFLGILILWSILTSDTYQKIFNRLLQGVVATILLTVIAYVLSVALGLIVALGRISSNVIARQVSTFYVEIMRGLPILVVLLYTAFVIAPAIVVALNGLGTKMIDAGLLPGVGLALQKLLLRDIDGDSTLRVTIALTLAYAAFISEIFRAGIESIERGQMEAARALGMTYWQAMRSIILRQAIRQVLPPLGNDFIAMLKDSSLISTVSSIDMAYQARTYAATSFKYFETYNVLAFLYLSMTLLLSMGVKLIERRMARERQQN